MSKDSKLRGLWILVLMVSIFFWCRNAVMANDMSGDDIAILDITNNSELATILTQWDWGSENVADFASKYQNQRARFDVHVIDKFSNQSVSSNYDYLFRAGDAVENTEGENSYGPAFIIRNVASEDLLWENETTTGEIEIGDLLTITADIDYFDDELDLFYLKLVSIDRRNKKNYSDPDVIKDIQEALNAAGYDCGVPDGKAGSKTRNAIAKYRLDNDLLEGEYIDWALYNALKYLNRSIGGEKIADNNGEEMIEENESINEYKDYMTSYLTEFCGEDHYYIESEGNVVHIAVWMDNVTALKELVLDGDEDAVSLWDELSTMIENMAVASYEVLKDYESEGHLLFTLMNDTNTDLVLLAYLDGEQMDNIE